MTSFYKDNKKSVDERYNKVHKLMNVSSDFMRKWKKHPCSKEASIKRLEVINRCIRILEKDKESWSYSDYRDAGKIISYISRASKITGGKPVSEECPETVNTYALLNWAYLKKGTKINMAKKKAAKKKSTKKVAKKKSTRKVAKKKSTKKVAKRKSAKRK